ncbi:MAG: Exonuclease of the beta-lactamase fold involved in processing-like protein [Planctomycetaceae bacterium]|nr:Exonuclease of the beta-lactamase fold involved in processing-like protein [Planctomycetaceae bacterium]
MTPAGLFCEAGEFFIDPTKAVSRAIITHAHADHARTGSREYLTATPGLNVLRTRLAPHAVIHTANYGETLDFKGVKVALHPAGHMLGSSQVRIEYQGEVWVVSGDYKVASDPTCAAFEPVRCHTFITESTFATPEFHWPDQEQVWAEINAWWRLNRAWTRASVLYCYAAGKSQRVLAGVDASLGPIITHEKVETVNADYRASGVSLPVTMSMDDAPESTDWGAALILAPPQVRDGRWLRRVGSRSTAFASGWMCTAGACAKHRVDHGFVLSDHADWSEVISAVKATGAENILVTHGYVSQLVQHLRGMGLNARPLEVEK